jgi:hypothetical protein
MLERRKLMVNDHVSQEEANVLIRQRMEEAETYGLQKQLGYGDSKAARWFFLLVVLLAAAAVGLLF